jgi:carboxyl-terminal processing protease
MKKTFLFTLLFLTVALFATNIVNIDYSSLQPEPQHRKVAPLVVKYLTNFHYQKRAVDDSLSSETYNRYFEKLDPSRVYFYQADIDRFNKYRYLLDDYTVAGNLEPAYENHWNWIAVMCPG